MTDEPKSLSKRLDAVMRRFDLSQTAVAKALEVSPSFISRILKGERHNISPRIEERLALLEKRGPLAQSQPQAQGPIFYGGMPENSPRSRLEAARIRAGYSRPQLAEAIGYEVGVLQALEQGSARISERLAERIVSVLPNLTKEDLLGGSEHAPIIGDRISTVGTIPDIATPAGIEARYVPLISWAQCGHLEEITDAAYDYEGHIAFNVQDRRAIAVQLKGDSMEPRFKEGDVAILYPSRKPQTGNLVIAKIRDEGVVFKRFQILSRDPARFRFISENPRYEPIERAEEEIEWIYPVANVVNNVL